MRVPSALESATGTAPAAMSDSRLYGRWLLLARAGWLLLAAGLLANFVASLPAYYQLMDTVCPLPNQEDCTSGSGQLTKVTVQSLAHLHLSLTGYAAYFVTLDVVVSFLPWGIGLLIFWRKSDERMSLFVSLLLILFAGNGVSNTLSGLWVPNPPPALLSVLLEVISGAQWIGLGAFLLTFPTGRFAPRWSWLVLSFWILTFVGSSLPLFSQDGALLGQVVVFLLEGLMVFGGTLFILVYRYRRVFDATERQQTKWVVYAAAAWVTVYLLGTALPGVLPADSPFQVLFPTTTIMLPSVFLFLGLGFAILRYRLWDIDAIINRTLVYGTLTTILTLTYVGVILGLQALTHALTGQTGDQPLVIVGSTLLIAALFNPLRRRIQTFIDRRFYRRKYSAEKTLAAFSATLRNEVDLEQIQQQLLAVVQETMQPEHVSLWLRIQEAPQTHQHPSEGG